MSKNSKTDIAARRKLIDPIELEKLLTNLFNETNEVFNQAQNILAPEQNIKENTKLDNVEFKSENNASISYLNIPNINKLTSSNASSSSDFNLLGSTSREDESNDNIAIEQ